MWDSPYGPRETCFVTLAAGAADSLQSCSCDEYVEACCALSYVHPHFQALRLLSMRQCKLEAIPLELPALTALEDLELSGNLIYDLPSTFAHLRQLRRLDLAHNRLQRLPRVLLELRALTSLNVQTNEELRFDAAAVAVARMPALQELHLPALSSSLSWTAEQVRAAMTVLDVFLCFVGSLAAALLRTSA